LQFFNRTCALVHVVGTSVVITVGYHRHRRTPTPMARCRPKYVALPLTRADVKAASCLDRISSASETHVTCTYTCRLTGRNCRAIYLRCVASDQATHQSLVAAEDLFTFKLNYRSSRRYLSQHCLVGNPMYTCHEHSVAVTSGAQSGLSFPVSSYLFLSPIRPSSMVVFS
jgi:hypothetical protein